MEKAPENPRPLHSTGVDQLSGSPQNEAEARDWTEEGSKEESPAVSQEESQTLTETSNEGFSFNESQAGYSNLLVDGVNLNLSLPPVHSHDRDPVGPTPTCDTSPTGGNMGKFPPQPTQNDPKKHCN